MSIDAVGNRTLFGLFDERASMDPDKEWIVFENRDGDVRTLTYGETRELILRTAGGLQSAGIGHGDKVLVHLRNCPEFIITWFALAAIGAVIVPSNVANTDRELAFIAGRADIVAAVTLPDYEQLFAGIGSHAPRCASVFVVGGSGRIDEARPFTDLTDHDAIDALPEVAPEDVSQILFTSGTTAKPKGVLVTHANALWSGERAAKGMGYLPHDRCLTSLPLFHVNGQAVTTLGGLTAQATIILLEQFVAADYMRQIVHHKATQTSLVATQSKALLAQPETKHDTGHRMRTIGHAINVTDEEHEAFERRFGVRFINIYGLSEATEIVTYSPLTGPSRWPSVGLPALDREVRIADEAGNECAPGEPGEIQLRGVRGRNIMLGYFEDPDATEQAFDGDWLRTGDHGYLDAEGYLFFVDRVKDLIKSSGQNISASEVEEALNLHPAIVESAVIAVAHPRRGEAVKAFVVASSPLEPAEVIAHCAEHLSKYKLPEFVEFLDALPRTSVGKIAKGELRQRG